MGSSVLGVSYGAGYMWGIVCYTLWSRVHMGSNVLGVPYGVGYKCEVVC